MIYLKGALMYPSSGKVGSFVMLNITLLEMAARAEQFSTNVSFLMSFLQYFSIHCRYLKAFLYCPWLLIPCNQSQNSWELASCLQCLCASTHTCHICTYVLHLCFFHEGQSVTKFPQSAFSSVMTISDIWPFSSDDQSWANSSTPCFHVSLYVTFHFSLTIHTAHNIWYYIIMSPCEMALFEGHRAARQSVKTAVSVTTEMAFIT